MTTRPPPREKGKGDVGLDALKGKGKGKGMHGHKGGHSSKGYGKPKGWGRPANGVGGMDKKVNELG